MSDESLSFHPLTPSRWKDFEELFGANGACGGCWCMFWKLKRSDFERQKGEANRLSMREIVKADAKPGILAYRDGKAIGWCAVAPRANYPALGRSRVLKPVDDRPVWSISCFFVHKLHRGQGVSAALIKAAVEFVKERGGEIVEGYPVEPKTEKSIPAAFAWTGLVGAFRKAGFEEAKRNSPTRPIMRKWA